MHRRISAILTAAGESTRMGQPKPLLEWRGVPLVRFQIESLLDADVHEVVVVLGHESERVECHVSGDYVRSVMNAGYRHGKTTSVLRGILSADPDATDLVLLAVDQPRPSWVVKRVIESHVENDALITSPRYEGRGGHPLVFSASLRGELESISDEGQGVREVFDVHRGEVNEVMFDDPIVRLDLNTPEEYEAARAKYRA
ncbi:MAG: nucleotidyltransferase family protein [Chloroflexota bacterium]|nr:nucleotidyltransferase family protein [Chloroflexota bacterium]